MGSAGCCNRVFEAIYELKATSGPIVRARVSARSRAGWFLRGCAVHPDNSYCKPKQLLKLEYLQPPLPHQPPQGRHRRHRQRPEQHQPLPEEEVAEKVEAGKR